MLLILAGISISMLSGENTILSKATEARDKTQQFQEDEQIKIAKMEAATNITDTEYEGIRIPAGYALTKKKDESAVDEGLVITDSDGNEYVWIEVPKNSATYGNEFNLNYNFNNMSEEEKASAYTAIATALRQYCTKDAQGGTLIALSGNQANSTMGWKDEYYDGCGIESAEEYTKLYNKMLRSVYENEGFWIGRYEAGISYPRESRNDTIEGIIPLSKKDLYPINFITCSQAQTIATKVPNKGNYTSSLMFGLQWDLVIKFLNNKGVSTSLLKSDSTSWGNYKKEYSLNQKIPHGYKGINTDGVVIIWSPIESGFIHAGGDTDYIALSTGASERNMKKNIYDLAGNLEEYTLEHSTSLGGQNCSVRGSGFTTNDYFASEVSYRGIYANNYAFSTSRISSYNILKKCKFLLAFFKKLC